MIYKNSYLDCYLQQRISNNAKELKNAINETLQNEQDCLEQIRFSINHCKKNITACENQMKKCSLHSLLVYESRKSAFKDNLSIWNTLGHIQMASIEMKEYIKRLSVKDIDEWEQRSVIKSAYTTIYETSKRLVDSTAEIIKFLKANFASYDDGEFTAIRKELTKFRENNTAIFTLIRNGIDAHRDKDINTQIEMIEGLHLSDAIKLIIDYENIVNKLGNTTKPIIELGIKRLQISFE